MPSKTDVRLKDGLQISGQAYAKSTFGAINNQEQLNR